MADSLYVCLFSNGHIKVGRSAEPSERVAAHAQRVSCLGVSLVDHLIVECVGPSESREQHLINLCVEFATARYSLEWFAGLDYQTVCFWANDAARMPLEDECQGATPFGRRLAQVRRASGLTQTQLAAGMGTSGADLNKAAVSTWEMGTCSPNTTQLRLICERLGVSADWLLFGSQIQQGN